MRLSLVAIGLALALTPAVASAQAPAAAAASHYSTANTPLGDILDDPAAKAVVDKYAPQLTKGDQINMARGMTLAGLQQYAPDMLSDKTLAQMDLDFAKLPPKK